MTSATTDDRYMLVLDERVFYRGYLGRRMKTRRLGAAALYLAPEGGFRLRDAQGRWRARDIALVPPYQAHNLVSPSGRMINVLIEPHRLAPGELEALSAALADPAARAALLRRLRAADERLSGAARTGGVAAAEFDRIVFGRALGERRIDPRIDAVIEALDGGRAEGQALAGDIAQGLGLSSSRFLHLFKEQTAVSFRNYRTWRRARHFLMHANRLSSLTDVALSLGYPDSSHFSHSIRRIYGLQPRSIRIGSQDLRVDSSDRMAAALQV